jgi:hypothetical protein
MGKRAFALDHFNLGYQQKGYLFPNNTALNVNTYEPAEIRFIGTNDQAASQYHVITA